MMDLTTNPITKEIVAVGRSGVAVSSNAGSSFQALANSPSGTKVHVDSQGRIIVVDWRGTGAWRLSGATWRQLRTDRLTFDVVADPTNPTRLVAVTNDHPWHDDAGASGVWVSYDDGATWNTRNDGLPMTRAAAVAFDPFAAGRVVVGTYGAGYWETQLESTPPPTTTTTTTTPTTSRPATTSSSSSSTSTNSTTTTTTQDGHPRSLPVSPILIEAMGAALRRQGIDTQR